MRNVFLPVLVAVTLGTSSMAMAAAAADLTANGVIKTIDAKACTITLADKSVYQFAAKCDFSKLTVGEKVVITYTKKGTVDEASKIVAA
jgi:Cu/Ag efflux protein CusF